MSVNPNPAVNPQASNAATNIPPVADPPASEARRSLPPDAKTRRISVETDEAGDLVPARLPPKTGKTGPAPHRPTPDEPRLAPIPFTHHKLTSPNKTAEPELAPIPYTHHKLMGGESTHGVQKEAGVLPTEKQAIANLKEILPGITEALDTMVAGAGQSSDDPVCDTAAGLVLGKLRELGYDAKLVDSGLHISVRIRTQGADVIVDPTMSQFFTDGSPTDKLLRAQGGFVGTEKQLGDFLRARHQDWTGDVQPTESAAEFRANAEKHGEIPEQEWRTHLRDVFLPEFTAQAMSHFTEKNLDGALAPSANAVAEAY